MALRDEKGRFISVKDKEAEIKQNQEVIKQFEKILELGGTLSKNEQEKLETARKANQERVKKLRKEGVPLTHKGTRDKRFKRNK